ncbi:MAG: 4'-phosphopantetheinyl transferase family protein [Jatrophihabitans sp.]
MRRQESRVDTVYAWVLETVQDQRTAGQAMLTEAGGWLLAVQTAEVTVSRDELGRPVVRAAAGQVWVSLSYGREVLAVAASLAGPVGIDVEGPRPLRVLELARRWFDPAEASWLDGRPAADQLNDFLLLWTAKEALGKALGSGLRGAGLQRRLALPPVADGQLRPAAGGLNLAQSRLAGARVLAIATGPGHRPAGQVVVFSGAHELLAARSALRSRTSLPVVVRGISSSTTKARGRL